MAGRKRPSGSGSGKTPRPPGSAGRRGEGGERALAQRVKTAKGRKLSSTRWIERQLNDPYVQRARADGFRSRAAYKLIEIEERFRLLKPGLTVVDLGAAPGGWSQVAAARTRASDAAPVVAIDILPMDPIPGVTVLTKDFFDDDAPRVLLDALSGRHPDVMLSDLAPETTGHRATDHLRIINLVELAAEFAAMTLKPGGAFLAKVFQGGTEGELLASLKRDYATVRHVKPPASRAGSPETYVLATGFRGSRLGDAEASDAPSD